MAQDPVSPIVLSGVTPELADKLRAYFAKNDGRGFEAAAGIAENACFASKYTYDEGSHILTMEPIRLMPNLTSKRLQRTIENILHPKPLVFADAGPPYAPTPSACAVYNWVVGFITNNSGGPLTYSSNDTDHGNFISILNSIPNGNQPSDQADTGVWQNECTKDSAVGCFGSVTYTLADGVTTMIISYGCNTSSTTSASVGLAGMNAARYTATVEKYQNYSGSKVCEYLYPYVTITAN